MKKLCLLMGALLVCGISHAEPKFEDYPVSVYKGKRALKSTSLTRTYATRFKEMKTAPIEFAGVYTTGGAGCGTGCYIELYLNVKTGKPLEVSKQLDINPYVACRDGSEGGISIQPDSRLMVVRGSVSDSNLDNLGERECVTWYYVEKNGRLIRVQ